jgi:HEPN domain-containing protein
MTYYRDFLDYAEGFYSSAREEFRLKNESASEKAILASILFSWIAIESFINNMMADFAALPPDTFSLPERALLTERVLEFIDHGKDAGKFIISDRFEYRRLDDKIMFLLAKFSKKSSLDKGGAVWQRFEAVKTKRNQITHPRKSNDVTVTLQDAEDALEVAKEVIALVSEKVWRKPIKL